MAAGLPANSPSRNPSGAAAAKQEASVKPGFQPSAAAQSTASATSSGSMVRTRNEPSFIKVRTQVDQCHATNKQDRKSTRLNSSHLGISYAVFCLKKKKKQRRAVKPNIANTVQVRKVTQLEH